MERLPTSSYIQELYKHLKMVGFWPTLYANTDNKAHENGYKM